MEFIFNTLKAAKYAVDLFLESTSFITELVGYLPSIIGSAVIVFVAVYVIRFLLLK